MDISRPGCHERHLLRRRDNPLFPAALRQVDAAQLAAARRRDAAERAEFEQQFRALLGEAAGLKPNEASETLLDLKARLDQAYTRLASLGGDTAALKQGLRRLTDSIIAAVQRAAAGDPLAAEELAQEQLARQQHYRLMEAPLAADLMRADMPLSAEELAATLLSAPADELEAALWLFGPDELAVLCREAEGLAATTAAARDNLARMQAHRSGG